MSKKHFVALADHIRQHNNLSDKFEDGHLATLADFCQSFNPRFNRERWLDYIAGKCGKNEGRITK